MIDIQDIAQNIADKVMRQKDEVVFELIRRNIPELKIDSWRSEFEQNRVDADSLREKLLEAGYIIIVDNKRFGGLNTKDDCSIRLVKIIDEKHLSIELNFFEV